MAEYIEREAAKKEFALNFGSVSHAVIANRLLDSIPTADVAPVVHGSWKEFSDDFEICATEFECSVCKESFCTSELTDKEFRVMMRYCPNCGARMDGE